MGLFTRSGDVEDVAHAQFELGCLAVILADQVRLNALLAANGRLDRIPLDPSMFVRFANTFLRKVWQNNNLSHLIDGSDGTSYRTKSVPAGFRCRNSIPGCGRALATQPLTPIHPACAWTTTELFSATGGSTR